MQEKRVESIREVDFSGLKVPFVAVYGHPDDFPGQIRGQNLRTGQSNRHNHGQRDTGRNRNGYQRTHDHDIHSERGGRCAVSGGRLDVGGQRHEKHKGI